MDISRIGRGARIGAQAGVMGDVSSGASRHLRSGYRWRVALDLDRYREHRPGVPDGDRHQCSLLRSVAVALRQRRGIACLQFFFPIHYTFTIADPASVLRSFLLHSWRLSSRMSRRGCASGRCCDDRARVTNPLCLQPQARRSRHLDDVLWATAYQTALMLKVRVVLLLPRMARSR